MNIGVANIILTYTVSIDWFSDTQVNLHHILNIHLSLLSSAFLYEDSFRAWYYLSRLYITIHMPERGNLDWWHTKKIKTDLIPKSQIISTGFIEMYKSIVTMVRKYKNHRMLNKWFVESKIKTIYHIACMRRGTFAPSEVPKPLPIWIFYIYQ